MEHHDEHDRHVVGSVALQLFLTVVASVLGALAIRVITGHYGAVPYGQIAVTTSLIGTVATLTDFGVFQIIQRDVAARPDKAGLLLGAAIGLRLLMNVVAIPIGFAITWALYQNRNPMVIKLFLIYAATLPMGSVISILYGYFAAKMKAPRITSVNQLRVILYIAGSIWAVMTDKSILWCAGADAVGSFVVLAIVLFMATREVHFRPRIELKTAGSIIKESTPAGLSGVIAQFYLQADTVILSLMTASRSVAFYAGAYAIIRPTSLVPSILNRAATPRLAREGNRSRTRILEILETYAVAGAGVTLILVAGAPVLVTVLLGGKFHQSITPLRILAAATVPLFLTAGFSNVAVATKATKRMSAVILGGFIANVILNVALIPIIGLRGSALATVICEIGMQPLMVRLVTRGLGIRLSPVTVSWRAVSALLISLVPALLLESWARGNFVRNSEVLGISALVFLVALGLVRGYPTDLVRSAKLRWDRS